MSSNHISKHLMILVFTFFCIGQFFLLGAGMADATGYDEALKGLNTTAGAGYLGKPSATANDLKALTTQDEIPVYIGKIIGVALSFIGVAFMLLIIYAGFTWMFARGNEADATKAKNMMVDAVIGLIIVMAAYAITSFVGGLLVSGT